jgi:regulatory protein
LGYRSRSEAEVRAYLRRQGYLPATDKVIEKLRSSHYLDDDAFARSWALSRAQGGGYGPHRIDQELSSKGIRQELIREALRETFDQVDETERAKRLLMKRFKGENLTEPKISRRAAAFLQRRGYSTKVIFDLLHYPIEED